MLLQNDNQLVERLCFPSMRHQEGDEIHLKDCVLLASGSKDEPPFVGKVAAIFQNPEDSKWTTPMCGSDRFRSARE